MKNHHFKVKIEGYLPMTPEVYDAINVIESSLSDYQILDWAYSLCHEDYTRFYYTSPQNRPIQLELKKINPQNPRTHVYSSYEEAVAARDEYDAQQKQLLDTAAE